MSKQAGNLLFHKFAKLVVGWKDHAHRHPEAPIFCFLSQDTHAWLEAKRSQGSFVEPSISRFRTWEFLNSVIGLNRDPPAPGKPGTRLQCGAVCRYGEGWLSEVREACGGWDFPKTDREAVDERIRMLSALFTPAKASRPLRVMDAQIRIDT